jgi:hypothetical protein
MNDLMKAYNWQMDVRAFLPIPGTKYELSVIPEYIYWYRDERGLISRSRTPQGIKFNCVVMSLEDTPDGKQWIPAMHVDIVSEEEFYDFMISIQREFGSNLRLA